MWNREQRWSQWFGVFFFFFKFRWDLISCVLLKEMCETMLYAFGSAWALEHLNCYWIYRGDFLSLLLFTSFALSFGRSTFVHLSNNFAGFYGLVLPFFPTLYFYCVFFLRLQPSITQNRETAPKLYFRSKALQCAFVWFQNETEKTIKKNGNQITKVTKSLMRFASVSS